MTASESLAEAIARQIDEVDRRVDGSGGYADERAQIRLAAQQIEPLRRSLGLGDFVRTLNPGTGKPQLLLVFRASGRPEVVLKVYGRVRPDEAAVQRLWWRAGVSTVEVLAAGDVPVSWLLMPVLAGEPPAACGAAEHARLTSELAEIMARAHRVPSTGPGHSTSLDNRVGRHLDNAVSALVRHGYQPPGDWSETAVRAYRSGRHTLLHGDLTPRNLLREPSGRLRLLDTCGYTGPAEFDAARWCARLGGANGAPALLDRWLEIEPELSRPLARRLLAVELLMEAGVRELVKEERREDWREHDPGTSEYLDSSVQLREEHGR